MTPEGNVKEKVKQLLRKHGTYWHCPVQTGMGAPSLDFICCHKGQYIGIETKAQGKKPTPRQKNTMRQIELAGGWCIVVDGEAALEKLAALLKLAGVR